MGTNRWLKYKVELLPIKEPSIEENGLIVTLADKILFTKKQDSSSDTSALEFQIDKLVYQLYDLTEDEIKIIENA